MPSILSVPALLSCLPCGVYSIQTASPARCPLHPAFAAAALLQAGSAGDPHWQVACNASSPLFGSLPLVVHEGR